MSEGHLRKPCVAVVGSLNVDLVTRTHRIPAGGETLASKSFDIGFGGKGANQAVACARLSRTRAQAANSDETDVIVEMVGAVGKDSFADDFLTSLKQDGLDVSKVEVIDGKKTGTAVIIVEEATGENRILISPGANADVRSTGLLPSHADVVIFQLEIPHEVVFETIKEAKKSGKTVILNPAPASPLPRSVFEGLDHLIVNETEAAIITGRQPGEITAESDLDAIAREFINYGVGHVIITLGSHGVFYSTASSNKMGEAGRIVPAERVTVVDTTAAGDTFVGGYAVAVARSLAGKATGALDVPAAVAFANKAASLTVQKEGAQSAIPWLNEVEL